jgi:indole-3-glycerol phosphate synthase/phosphoribosylanthranilate isomerase
MLEQIVARTRDDVARRMRERPLASWRAAVRPSPRSFAAALRVPHTGFVMECKRASPSEGVLRDRYDPAAIAASYAPYADAISVLTDGPFFRGSHDHLRAVRSAVDVPVLCKDFVVDPYQVFEAREAGADAVLLMLSILDDDSYAACASAAAAAGIETLTEAHSGVELDRALALGAPVIGINNRDLSTLRVDLDTVRRLAPRMTRERLVICESGIRSHSDVRELGPLVDGFLVGTSLMRSTGLPHAVRALVFGMTKVCGLTRPEDAEAAWAAGATHGGLIFAAESPRAVDEATAERVRLAAPLLWVGVFVNDSPRRIAAIASRLRLAAVQLHGDETADDVAALRSLLPPGCEVWKAVRVRDEMPATGDTGADRVLLDRWHPSVRGGTGERFDWSLLAGGADKGRLILSGGLTPETVAAAETLGVAALDVNSGVEHSPGIKSPVRLAAFFAERRGTGREH